MDLTMVNCYRTSVAALPSLLFHYILGHACRFLGLQDRNKIAVTGTYSAASEAHTASRNACLT